MPQALSGVEGVESPLVFPLRSLLGPAPADAGWLCGELRSQFSVLLTPISSLLTPELRFARSLQGSGIGVGVLE